MFGVSRRLEDLSARMDSINYRLDHLDKMRSIDTHSLKDMTEKLVEMYMDRTQIETNHSCCDSVGCEDSIYIDISKLDVISIHREKNLHGLDLYQTHINHRVQVETTSRNGDFALSSKIECIRMVTTPEQHETLVRKYKKMQKRGEE